MLKQHKLNPCFLTSIKKTLDDLKDPNLFK